LRLHIDPIYLPYLSVFLVFDHYYQFI